MKLFSSLTLVAAVLAAFDVSSAQGPGPYTTYVPTHPLGPILLPPSETKVNSDWIIQFFRDLNWDRYLHDPGLHTQLTAIIPKVLNYTHTSSLSPSQIQQIALKHEDIYKSLHHFAEILRYHPNWKTLVSPYIQQHHLSSKYLNMFEQLMLFFLLHSFPGHPSTKPNFPFPPPGLPPQPFPPTYPPFEPYPPFQPFAPPIDPYFFRSQPWLDGYGTPQPWLDGYGTPPYQPFGEPNFPQPPFPSYEPFPDPRWNQRLFPHPLIVGKPNCAEMVNVTLKVKVYNEDTCTTSVYAPRQNLKNFLAIAAQENSCFNFKTEKRRSRTGSGKGEYISLVNTIRQTDLSKWSVLGKRTADAELNSYKPSDKETITLTFNLQENK